MQLPEYLFTATNPYRCEYRQGRYDAPAGPAALFAYRGGTLWSVSWGRRDVRINQVLYGRSSYLAHLVGSVARLQG